MDFPIYTIVKNVIFILVLVTDVFRCPYENAIRWLTRDLTDDKAI